MVDIAEHPLRVYYTALPLLPSHSMLHQLFHDSLVEPSVVLMPSNSEWISSMAFSTDARRLVIGYKIGVSVCDTATGKVLLHVSDMTGEDRVVSVVFSYNGSRIACGTDESTIYVWDSVSGARVIGPLRHSGSSPFVNAVAWSKDGNRLLSGCRTGEVMLWSVTDPKGARAVANIHHRGCSAGKPLRSVALSPEGSQIASCSEQGDVHVWDSKNGGILWSVQDRQAYDPWISVSFLSSDMGAFLIVKTKKRTQARDAATGNFCPLPDSLAGVVGFTHDDFMINLLTESIAKHHPKTYGYPRHDVWATQGEYFAFSHVSHQCYVVHLPK